MHNGGIFLNHEGVLYIQAKPELGLSPQIGHLVSMMNYARFVTTELVGNLSVEQLDYVHDEQSNSIGALLLHIAAIETLQQVWSFEDRPLNELEQAKWGVALKLGNRARSEIVGFTCKDYLDCLTEVRLKTLQEFRRRGDDWLYQEVPNKPTNQYCRWFHVIEDEISHRGQMKWILGRLPTVNPSTAGTVGFRMKSRFDSFKKR